MGAPAYTARSSTRMSSDTSNRPRAPYRDNHQRSARLTANQRPGDLVPPAADRARDNANYWTSSAVADGALPAPSFFERLQPPTRSPTRQRVSALRLRFADPRLHALSGALCRFNHLPDGFRNRDLCPLVAAQLSREPASYTASARVYDLCRLPSHGVIQSCPNGRCVTPSRRTACAGRSCTTRTTAACGDHTDPIALILNFRPVSPPRSTNSTVLS